MEISDIQRRPLKSREKKWAHALSGRLIKTGLKPNQVSVFSIVFAVLAGAAFFSVRSVQGIQPKAVLFLFAAAFIQLRLLCNLMDGMMAIEGGLKEKWGDILNDLPDRISDVVILVSAGYSITKIPYSECLGWLAAIMAMMTAYIRLLGGSLGAKQYFIGPMAKQHRMAALTISCIIAVFSLPAGAEDIIIAICLAAVILGSIASSARRLIRINKDLQELK
jgi:phosphatidylglycerophosphate synthase